MASCKEYVTNCFTFQIEILLNRETQRMLNSYTLQFACIHSTISIYFVIHNPFVWQSQENNNNNKHNFLSANGGADNIHMSQYAKWCDRILQFYSNFKWTVTIKTRFSVTRLNQRAGVCLCECAVEVESSTNRGNDERTTIIMPRVLLWFGSGHVDQTNVCISFDKSI